MSTKKILLICAIALLGLMAIIGMGGYLFVRMAIRPQFGASVRTAKDVGPVGVALGKGFLQKRVFLSEAKLGTVTDIAFGRLDPRPQVSLVAAGKEGAGFFTSAGKEVSSFAFPELQYHVQVVDVEGDGACEFWERGFWSDDPTLFSHSGKVLWKLPDQEMGIDDSWAGDINGDGYLEFVVGFNGVGGTRLFDHRGRQLWKVWDTNVTHLEMADVNGDGHLEVMTTSGNGQLKIRDRRGAVLSQVLPVSGGLFGRAVMKFALARWPDRAGPYALLRPTSEGVEAMDLRGKTLATFRAPKSGVLRDFLTTSVKLRADAPPYRALLFPFRLDRSLLFVYDPQQRLVYQEVLPETAEALAAMPLQKTGAEALLVGGNGRVLKYVAAAPPPRAPASK